MKRREFIAMLGSAAVGMPLNAHAQQKQAMPVIGFLRNSSPEVSPHLLTAFRLGLSEAGYSEGQNVAIDYHWAQGNYALLPNMAAELVRRGTTVIFAGGTGEALAAKAATTSIPIVFSGASDPVEVGLVGSLNRPGGNITGATMIAHSLGSKRLELLRRLVPNAATIAMLVNPNNPSMAAAIENTQDAARAMGLELVLLKASHEREFDAAFTSALQRNVGALFVAGDPLFTGHGLRIVALANQHKLPAIYSLREYALSGGLMSYGTSFADSYRQCGVYVGRILKGEKPGDLPVMLPTRFELVINTRTAKAHGLDVPYTLIAIADEVIE